MAPAAPRAARSERRTHDADEDYEPTDHDIPAKAHHAAQDSTASTLTTRPTRSHKPPNDDASSSSSSSTANISSPSTPTFPPPHRTSTLSKSYTPTEEHLLLRKLDRNLTLFLSLLYLLSFLDRSNIGNARIAGLSTSLNLTSSQYSWLLTAFYITYILFEPLILCYRFLPARFYIPTCVIAWGVVASCQSLVSGFAGMVVLRAALGVTEAAFGPGVPFYMTFFYRRRELAWRVGLQVSAAPLATSFASLLAWAIVWVNEKVGKGSVESWRVLFLVEGFPSVVVGVWALWWVPDGPGGVRWLSPRERRVAVLRLQEEKGKSSSVAAGSRGADAAAGWRERAASFGADLRTTLADPKCYLTALMFFSVNVSFASLPVFLPTIINDMDFSALTSQALAAPPYLCAFGFVLLIGHYSDAIQDSRAIFLICSAGMSAVSYAIIALAGAIFQPGSGLGIAVRYAFVYPAAMGLFASVVLIITWTLNNQASETGKGVAMTVLNLLGQCGPLVGVRLFPDGDAPGFVRGMAVCGGFMGGVVVLAGGLRWWLGRLNRWVLFEGPATGVVQEAEEVEMRERLMARDGEGEGEERDQEEEFRERPPDVQRFRFML